MAASDGGPAQPVNRLHVRRLARIGEVPAAGWDALASGNPFVTHGFLDALERHGCVGPATGWEPCHLVLEDGHGTLHGAMPLYRKRHSYGEFVFDWTWAHAAGELGIAYYPKLVCAVPFTPSTGPRLLARSDDGRDALLQAALELAREASCSSLHVLFPGAADAPALTARALLERNDVQFHWFSRGDREFDAFLGRLRHDKRKKIRRERRRIVEAGIRFETRRGDELTEPEWRSVYALYANTYAERGQAPYLSLPFFLDFGARRGTPVRLVLAFSRDAMVAAAIFVAGGDTLYGRHWGCARDFHSLHFETCYYQGIELCLREGLARFDAGAQGAHKLARGFEPVLTRSAHLLADGRLHGAVGAYLERERAWIGGQQRSFAEHSPYRSV